MVDRVLPGFSSSTWISIWFFCTWGFSSQFSCQLLSFTGFYWVFQRVFSVKQGDAATLCRVSEAVATDDAIIAAKTIGPTRLVQHDWSTTIGRHSPAQCNAIRCPWRRARSDTVISTSVVVVEITGRCNAALSLFFCFFLGFFSLFFHSLAPPLRSTAPNLSSRTIKTEKKSSNICPFFEGGG